MDRKWALESGSVASPETFQFLVSEAFRSGSRWLREVVYRQVGRLHEVPTDVRREIRAELVTQMRSGDLRRERVAVNAVLRRLPDPDEFLATARLLRAIEPVDLALCVAMATCLVAAQSTFPALAVWSVALVAHMTLRLAFRAVPEGQSFWNIVLRGFDSERPNRRRTPLRMSGLVLSGATLYSRGLIVLMAVALRWKHPPSAWGFPMLVFCALAIAWAPAAAWAARTSRGPPPGLMASNAPCPAHGPTVGVAPCMGCRQATGSLALRTSGSDCRRRSSGSHRWRCRTGVRLRPRGLVRCRNCGFRRGDLRDRPWTRARRQCPRRRVAAAGLAGQQCAVRAAIVGRHTVEGPGRVAACPSATPGGPGSRR